MKADEDEWEFDAEACCRDMEEWMKWEFEEMMRDEMLDQN